MVERNVANVKVASSRLVSRSIFRKEGLTTFLFLFLHPAGWQSGHAAACKAVDAGSIPTPASRTPMKQALLFCCLLFLAFAGGAARAQGGGGTGLEMEHFGTLDYLVEELTPDALKLGLTGQHVRSRVEFHLRRAGISPRPSSLAAGPYLYVLVNVTGMVFSVRVEMQRPVSYSVGKSTQRRFAATWQTGGVGQSPTPGYIVATLDRALKTFVSQYLAANR